VSDTYANVDSSSDPEFAVEAQERVDQWPDIRAYKRRVIQLLPGIGPILDVGCGPGADVLAIGSNRCCGIDLSMTMCRATASRKATVGHADAHSLPFCDRSFSGVVADRVLQHVGRPAVVLDELVRVLSAGGRLVIVDPDQDTLEIEIPGLDPRLVERVRVLRRDIGYRNGRLISSMPAEFTARGLFDPDEAFGLPDWPRYWRAEGGFSDGEIAAWDEAIAQSRAGGFRYSLSYGLVWGMRT
jgi:SAM-dependent methyltransferase